MNPKHYRSTSPVAQAMKRLDDLCHERADLRALGRKVLRDVADVSAPDSASITLARRCEVVLGWVTVLAHPSTSAEERRRANQDLKALDEELTAEQAAQPDEEDETVDSRA